MKNEKLKQAIINKSKTFFPLEVGYDNKIHYLVLPFTSKIGNILGFTKRRIDIEGLEPRKIAKWIHSYGNNTLITNCKNIFNLDMAIKNIKLNNNEVIFVEGCGDVASLIRAGYKNVVSISGTSNFSTAMLDILKPLQSIVLMMDGDEAGIKSTKADIVYLAKNDPMLLKNTFIAQVINGKDPGDSSADEIKSFMNNKISALNWYINNNDDNVIAELYNSTNSDIIKKIIISCINYKYNYNTNESLELLSMQKKSKNDINASDLYNQLLAIIGKGDPNTNITMNLSEEEATRMLKLRFNYKDE